MNPAPAALHVRQPAALILEQMFPLSAALVLLPSTVSSLAFFSIPPVLSLAAVLGPLQGLLGLLSGFPLCLPSRCCRSVHRRRRR